MRADAAAWSMAVAVSLAVHSGILMGLGGMARAPGMPPAAELLIGDQADLSTLAVNPISAEAGSADLVASSGTALRPRENLPVAADRVESSSDASTQKAPAQRLAPFSQASEYGPVKGDQAVRPIQGNAIAAENHAHDLAPASEHLNAAAEAEQATKYSPAEPNRQLAAVAQSDAALPAGPALKAQETRKEMQVAAAKDDAEETAPVASNTVMSGNPDALRLPSSENQSAEIQSVPAGNEQPGQPPAEVVDKASSETYLSAAGDAKVAAPLPENDRQPDQPPPQAIAIASSDARLAAAGNGDVAVSVPSENDKSAIAPVSGGREVKSSEGDAQHARGDDNASRISPVPGGQELVTTQIEPERVEGNAGVPPAHQPVQSDIAEQAAPVSEGNIAAPVVSEPQQPARNETLAMVAPHPAIILPPAKVLPDDPLLRMASFIRDYDGGFCFFAVPRALDGPKPRIEGFGSRPELIRSFGDAFRRTIGIEPELGMRQITTPQCPVLDFVGAILKSHGPEIAVGLASDSIAAGDELRGTLDGVRLSHVSLLLVDDDGVVHDVSSYLRRTVDGLEFAAPIQLTGKGQGRNQLVVSVAADRELEFMRPNKDATGEDYFLSAIDEARAAGAEISVGLGAFRVE